MHSYTFPDRAPDRVAAAGGNVSPMTRRVQDRTYRSTGELIRAIRDEHLLTQEELAGRCGLSRYQLCRYEKGIREPTLQTMRRVLDAVGLAVSFGVEPSTAALDERLEPGADAMSLDTWLMANRVIWPALTAGLPVVVGGEFAAGLQGAALGDPEMVLYVRLTDLDVLRRVVQTARCTLSASLDAQESEEIAVGSELAVVAMVGTIRVVLVAELPVARVIAVERRFAEQGSLVDVPVVPLVMLHESGVLGPAAAALAARLLQRMAEHG